MSDTDLVREARSDDVPDLADLHVVAWKAAYPGILSSEVLDKLSAAEFEIVWRGNLARADRTNLVIVKNGRVAGFVAFGAVSGSATDGEIHGIFVHPVRWRFGLGRTLMSAALDRLRQGGTERVSLWVMEDNVASRRFYEALGFISTGATRTSERLGCRFAEVEYLRGI